MNQKLRKFIANWPKPYFTGTHCMVALDQSIQSRQAILKRAVQEGELIRLRKDLYFIKNRLPIDMFEIALILYGPSYISFESALAFHGWIPESVPVCTCATTKRSREFNTPLGIFSYHHIPIPAYSMGIQQLHQTFMAHPWKAIADLIYVQKKTWKSMRELSADLRIEKSTIDQSELKILDFLSKNYPNQITRRKLQRIMKWE